ncbi:hypothetical protein ACEQ8H_002029 [Pleosporales sp. CAS-2024a]
MYLVSVLFALAVPAVVSSAVVPKDVPDPGTSMILGGVRAGQGEIPFAVTIELDGTAGHQCDGILLNRDTVLSTGKCFNNRQPGEFFVRAGTTNRVLGGAISRISSIIIHPDFYASRSVLDFDVAILKLSRPILTSSTIQYANLPPSGSDPATRTWVTVAGWGATQVNSNDASFYLMKTWLSVVGRGTCTRDYRGAAIITDRMFCLTSRGKDTLAGDQGGPVFDSKTVVGMPSWGTRAGDARRPGIYVRIGHPVIMSFIQANL